MKQAEDLIFDSGFGTNDSYNGGISLGTLNNLGGSGYNQTGNGNIFGGGGGGISSGAGAGVVLSSTPGTVLSDRNFVISVVDNVNGAIYLNGENTYKVAPDSVSISVAEILKHGRQYITVVKDGYQKSIKYSVGIKENPKYKYAEEPISFNPASSIFGGMSGFGYNGWQQLNQIPTYNSFSDNPYYSLRITKTNEFGLDEEIVLDNINATYATATFELNKINQTEPTPSENTNVVTINLNGDDDSAKLTILNDGNTNLVSLKSGINYWPSYRLL